MKFLTMKFGGTSVGDVNRIKAVADTIRSELKPNRKIIISILPKINPGLDKENFLKSLEKQIYLELDKIH